jgi:hypothetical protein
MVTMVELEECTEETQPENILNGMISTKLITTVVGEVVLVETELAPSSKHQLTTNLKPALMEVSSNPEIPLVLRISH